MTLYIMYAVTLWTGWIVSISYSYELVPSDGVADSDGNIV